MAALISGLVLAIGSAGMLVTTEPAPVSLLLEPFSLLLAPGLLIAVETKTRGEPSPMAMIEWAGAFYLLVSYLLLSWRARRAHRSRDAHSR